MFQAGNFLFTQSRGRTRGRLRRQSRQSCPRKVARQAHSFPLWRAALAARASLCAARGGVLPEARL
eukprot:5214233-Pyramimonas_sp.AAC.1